MFLQSHPVRPGTFSKLTEVQQIWNAFNYVDQICWKSESDTTMVVFRTWSKSFFTRISCVLVSGQTFKGWSDIQWLSWPRLIPNDTIIEPTGEGRVCQATRYVLLDRVTSRNRQRWPEVKRDCWSEPSQGQSSLQMRKKTPSCSLSVKRIHSSQRALNCAGASEARIKIRACTTVAERQAFLRDILRSSTAMSS